FFTQSGDSVAVVSAKWFARSFARASGIQVDIISSRDAIPETLAEDGGYDGLAYFVLDRVFNVERDEYMLSIRGEMVHAVSKRAMTTVDYELPPSFLYRKMTQAGVDMSRHMGYEPNAGGREDE
ncbi:hypothetical protein K8S17_05475, partial [bacterium]|nr:hypothetical protein [bacterium]